MVYRGVKQESVTHGFFGGYCGRRIIMGNSTSCATIFRGITGQGGGKRGFATLRLSSPPSKNPTLCLQIATPGWISFACRLTLAVQWLSVRSIKRIALIRYHDLCHDFYHHIVILNRELA